MTRATGRVLVVSSLLLALSGASVVAQDAPLVPWTGGPMPLLALKDVGGRLHDLTEYRGKAVIVNFWATWCAPCREELPSLERLREALRDKPFEVLTVNVNEGESRVRRFLAEVPLQLPVLLDRTGQTQRAWKVRGLPTTFVLAPDGSIRYWYLGELDWAQSAIRHTVESLLRPTR